MTLPARPRAALLTVLLIALLLGVALTSARAVGGADVAPQRSARTSGLAWHSGVFSHDAAQTTRFAQARGRPVDVLAVFPSRDSWEAIMQDWWMSPSAVPEGFTGTLAVGVPLFPDGGSMSAAATGADDARWEELGRLIASRYPDAWVRPGWEMNIPNWPWAATPENVHEYKAAFRHAAIALKRGGPGLRIVFNPNEGRGGSLPDARLAYPGDDVVDVIGIDAYDWYPAYDSGGWQEHKTKDQGWDFWASFARDRGKKFAVPEWGVMPGSSESGGDNPTYIRSVLEWMGANADIMAFDAYFEETQDYCRCALSLNPRAAAEYAKVLPRVAAPTGAVAAAPGDVTVSGAEASATAAPAPLADSAPERDRAAPDEEPTEQEAAQQEPAQQETSQQESAGAPDQDPTEQESVPQQPEQPQQPQQPEAPAATPTAAPSPNPTPDLTPPTDVDEVPGETQAPATEEDGTPLQSTRRPGRGLYGRDELTRVVSPVTGPRSAVD